MKKTNGRLGFFGIITEWAGASAMYSQWQWAKEGHSVMIHATFCFYE